MSEQETRLNALRHKMSERGFDALLIPRADVHQGEEVAACDERLAYATGFTGSAGMALITLDGAHLFVDGRYTLQVQNQSPAPLFTHHSLVDEPAHKVAQSLGLKSVGYDPKLFTKASLARFEPTILNPSDDLVAAIWTDRPAAPKGAIVDHPLSFAGDDRETKLQRVRTKMDECGADWLLLTLPDSICWLLNIRGRDLSNTTVPRCFLIVGKDDATLFVHDGDTSGFDLSNLSLAPYEAVFEKLSAVSGSIWIDPSTAPLAATQRLSADAKVLEKAEPVIPLKARKNDSELQAIRAAHRRDAVAVTQFLCWIKTTAVERSETNDVVTEIEAVEKLRGLRSQQDDFIGDSFSTISGAGPNGAIVHYRVDEASNRALNSGDLYLVDSGGQYVDGTTDITRTLAIGPVSQEAIRCNTLVLKGHIALATTRFAKGTTGQALDAIARQPLWQAGLDYDHGTGHGVGASLNVHEGPARIAKPMGPTSLIALDAGMLLSNEPGYYRQDAFGIRIENLVAVQPWKAKEGDPSREFFEFETLSFAPLDPDLIDFDMLTGDERTWLSDYHKQVAEVLEGQLPIETANWLADVIARFEV